VLEKPKRKQDKDLLESIKQMCCLCCGTPGVDAHHVTSIGAGGHDTPENLQPLCRKHHAQYHAKGQVYMFDMYPLVRSWFKKHDRLEEINRARKRSTKLS